MLQILEASCCSGRFLFSFSGLGLVGFRAKAAFWRTHCSRGARAKAEIVYELSLQLYHIPGELEGRNPSRRTLLKERKQHLINISFKSYSVLSVLSWNQKVPSLHLGSCKSIVNKQKMCS